MRSFIYVALMLIVQNSFADTETSYNLFRSPSVGIEQRNDETSLHIGIYMTVLTPIGAPTKTSWFVRLGVNNWSQPMRDQSNYAGVSLVYGLSDKWKGELALLPEVGSRWYFSRTEKNAGNLRLGASLLVSPSFGVFLRPNPSVGYSVFGE